MQPNPADIEKRLTLKANVTCLLEELDTLIYMIVKRLTLICLAAVLLTACGKKGGNEERQPVAVGVTAVGGTGYDTDRSYVGTVTERTATILSFEVAGSVNKMLADEGDRVSKGQLLATVTPTTLKDMHYSATVALKQARDAYKRMKPLREQGVISEIKWVDVESKLQQAEAAERIAREQLSHTGLYAPAAGVIASRTAEPGMTVAPGQQVYKLVDVSSVEISVAIPENEIATINKGMRARVTVSALGNAGFYATVTEKGVTANPVSHTYNVKLSLANPGGRLMPGMVCNVSMATDGSHDRLTVPLNAVELDTDNTRFVWLAVDGRAVKRPITVGDFAGDGIEVTEGLSAGDLVITSGAHKVSQGMKITVK